MKKIIITVMLTLPMWLAEINIQGEGRSQSFLASLLQQNQTRANSLAIYLELEQVNRVLKDLHSLGLEVDTITTVGEELEEKERELKNQEECLAYCLKKNRSLWEKIIGYGSCEDMCEEKDFLEKHIAFLKEKPSPNTLIVYVQDNNSNI